MLNKAQKTKTAKLTYRKQVCKFGCTVSVYAASVVMVVRLLGCSAPCSAFSASSSAYMYGNVSVSSITPNRTAYPAFGRSNVSYGKICHAKIYVYLVLIP